MKKTFLIILAVIILTKPIYADTYTDVSEEDWFSDWIDILVEFQITSGYEDSTFKPMNEIRRIELLSMTLKALGINEPVSDKYWGQNIINRSIKENIISEDSLFVTEPDKFTTREETAKIIYNAYLRENEIFSSVEHEAMSYLINDYDEISYQYKEGVVGVYLAGIVEGNSDSTFNPKGYLTRAEASVFISRLFLHEKRVIQPNLNIFYYETESKLAPKLAIACEPKFQDIYNILTLAHTIENEDTNNGFALISDLSEDGNYNIALNSSLNDYDNAQYYNVADYMRWAIKLRKNQPPTEYTGDIEILSWRKKEDINHQVVMKAIFDYLFEDESEYVWDIYLEYANFPEINEVVGTVVNNRNIQFKVTANAIQINIERVDYEKVVDINDYVK